jgi:hypothetical protein
LSKLRFKGLAVEPPAGYSLGNSRKVIPTTQRQEAQHESIL